MADEDLLRFPPSMPPDAAQVLLREAYEAVPEGRLLRRTNKLLRRRGIDPPMDVQYVAQPAVVAGRGGLEVDLGVDIMVYDDFPELGDCVKAFEDVLRDLLRSRLEKRARAWERSQKKRGP